MGRSKKLTLAQTDFIDNNLHLGTEYCAAGTDLTVKQVEAYVNANGVEPRVSVLEGAGFCVRDGIVMSTQTAGEIGDSARVSKKSREEMIRSNERVFVPNPKRRVK